MATGRRKALKLTSTEFRELNYAIEEEENNGSNDNITKSENKSSSPESIQISDLKEIEEKGEKEENEEMVEKVETKEVPKLCMESIKNELRATLVFKKPLSPPTVRKNNAPTKRRAKTITTRKSSPNLLGSLNKPEQDNLNRLKTTRNLDEFYKQAHVPSYIKPNLLFTPTPTTSKKLLKTKKQYPFFDKYIYKYLSNLPDGNVKSSITYRLFPDYTVEELYDLRLIIANPPEPIEPETEQQKIEREWRELIDRDALRTALICINGEKSNIKGGTFLDIVYAITGKDMCSNQSLSAFLLTYRSFGTPHDLLDILIERFNVPLPLDAPKSNEFNDFFHTYKRQPIQIRTGKAIKRWVDTHWYDFVQNDCLIQKVLDWIRNVLKKSEYEQMASLIEQTIVKKMDGTKLKIIHFTEFMPPSILPKKLSFLSFHTLEVARQLCLIEFESFAQIKAQECIHQAWTKKDKESVSPNICKIIQYSNKIPMSFASIILSEVEPSARANIIVFLIKIAVECDILNNFNGVMEILAGLQLTPIYRLKKSWELVPKEYIDEMERLKKLMSVDDNWKEYRSILKIRNPPCLPYLGLYLTDLTFIEDGNKDYLESKSPNTIINFVKCKQLSIIIQDIQQYQQKMYYFHKVEAIQNHLLNMEPLSADDMYQVSISLEPRTG